MISLFKKDATWKLETMKVGGPENMKLVEQLYSSESYISQQTMAIEQALAQIKNNNIESDVPENNNEDQDSYEKNQSILDQLNKIKKSGVDYGKESARFTILEYSELLCPYCKRHSDQ